MLSESTTLPSGLAASNLTLTTPNLGTPSAVTLTNGTGLPGTGLTTNSVTSTQLALQTIQYASVTLTHAQVIALFTTQVQIIPSQGVNTLTEVQSCMLENVSSGAAYTAGGVISLVYSGTATVAAATVAASFLTTPTVKQAIIVTGALASTAISTLSNTAVNIRNVTAAFATGGTGTLVVNCAYRVHTLQ